MLATFTWLERRDANRDRNGHGFAFEVEWAGLNGAPKRFGQFDPRAQWRGRNQQDELFATESRNKVRGPQALAQFVGDDFQDLVTGQVAVVVIDVLEVIEVEHGQQQIST
ncbi:hypothetical protein D3C80_875810 [compost metagenome]